MQLLGGDTGLDKVFSPMKTFAACREPLGGDTGLDKVFSPMKTFAAPLRGDTGLDRVFSPVKTFAAHSATVRNPTYTCTAD